MQTTIKRQSPPVNKGSKLFAIRRGAKVAATSVSPYLSHHACHRNTSSPYKRDYFNLPALFDLPWPFMTEAASKRCHELKSPISLSLALSRNAFFSCAQALPLSILFRQKLGVANILSPAHQERKQKTGSSAVVLQPLMLSLQQRNWMSCDTHDRPVDMLCAPYF